MTREEFVLSGIQDTVGTIRAYDTKAQIFLAILFIPLTNCEFWIEKANSYHFTYTLSEIEIFPTLWYILLFVLFFFTIACAFFLMRTIFPQPVQNAVIEDAPGGVFYSSKLPEKSPLSFREIKDEYPKEETIIDELIYEHFKLKRIRQKKETTFRRFMKVFKMWFCFGVFFILLTFVI